MTGFYYGRWEDINYMCYKLVEKYREIYFVKGLIHNVQGNKYTGCVDKQYNK